VSGVVAGVYPAATTGHQPVVIRADGDAAYGCVAFQRVELAAASAALRSHSRAALSRGVSLTLLPVTSQWLSALKAAVVMDPVCPTRFFGLAAECVAVRSTSARLSNHRRDEPAAVGAESERRPTILDDHGCFWVSCR